MQLSHKCLLTVTWTVLIETCYYWRQSCCEWYAALGTCLSSSKTMLQLQHMALLTQSSFCAVTARHPASSSVLTLWLANRRDLDPVDYCIWAWCGSLYTMYQSVIRTTCVSGLLSFRHGLIFSTVWWTMRLFTGEKDLKHVHVSYPCRRWSLWTLAVTFSA